MGESLTIYIVINGQLLSSPYFELWFVPKRCKTHHDMMSFDWLWWVLIDYDEFWLIWLSFDWLIITILHDYYFSQLQLLYDYCQRKFYLLPIPRIPQETLNTVQHIILHNSSVSVQTLMVQTELCPILHTTALHPLSPPITTYRKSLSTYMCLPTISKHTIYGNTDTIYRLYVK